MFNLYTARRSYQKVLTSLSQGVVNTKFHLRGKIPRRGEAILKDIEAGNGHKYAFSRTQPLNSANAQNLGQKVITFNREVLAGLQLPSLINTQYISQDASDRIQQIQKGIDTQIGAYTANSKGYPYIRKLVAKMIDERDENEEKSDDNAIYLTNGCSEAVTLVYQMLIRNSNDGIMIPIPQYPLFSAAATLGSGQTVPYFLSEEKGWTLNTQELGQIVRAARDNGTTIRAMVVINPGNPTGAVYTQDTLEEIIKFCHQESIAIMADEVYQDNIYLEDRGFVSMRKALLDMGEPYASECEIFSINSISKGLLGECGLRGGYVECMNLSPLAQEMLYKIKSIQLCSNTIGQIATGLMCDPPKRGRESDDCVDLYEKETGHVVQGLKKRAHLMQTTFNQMINITCQPIQGACYAYPRIIFSHRFLDHARKLNMQPDFLYCMELLEQTGIMTVPGSGFGQREGTYHFRVANLMTPTTRMELVLQILRKFNNDFHQEWQ